MQEVRRFSGCEKNCIFAGKIAPNFVFYALTCEHRSVLCISGNTALFGMPQRKKRTRKSPKQTSFRKKTKSTATSSNYENSTYSNTNNASELHLKLFDLIKHSWRSREAPLLWSVKTLKFLNEQNQYDAEEISSCLLRNLIYFSLNFL